MTVDSATFTNGSYTDSGLVSGTGYQYILQAYTSVDEANSTNTEVIYTNSEPVSDDDIVISDITTDGFKVSFTAPKQVMALILAMEFISARAVALRRLIVMTMILLPLIQEKLSWLLKI